MHGWTKFPPDHDWWSVSYRAQRKRKFMHVWKKHVQFSYKHLCPFNSSKPCASFIPLLNNRIIVFTSPSDYLGISTPKSVTKDKFKSFLIFNHWLIYVVLWHAFQSFPLLTNIVPLVTLLHYEDSTTIDVIIPLKILHCFNISNEK